MPGPNPQGEPASFDVLSPTHAWLLAAGQGLWLTTDGRHWHALGAVRQPVASAGTRPAHGSARSSCVASASRTSSRAGGPIS